MESNGFCESLTRARNNMGLSKSQLAARVSRSPSTVTRWERGEYLPDRDDAELLDRVLQCGGDLLREWQVVATGSVVPHWKQRVPYLEQNSVAIHLVYPYGIPGLIQATEYVELMLREGLCPGSDEQIRAEAKNRAGRYDALAAKGAPWVTAVFPASCLSRLPPSARQAQARRLADLIDAGRVTVNLLGDDAVIDMVAPLMGFQLTDGTRVLASEHNWDVVVHDQPKQVETLLARIQRATQVALSEGQSVEMVKEMARE
ncbi:helix-turn-helix domain-containing protein [Nocardiopsis sp. EMB25]|uniref:helix-turn-helix domain-containing protein n=1 Tax=Nocardiopsis TaxID=2013 RepID=UPI0003465EBB|nr:MULTISPECIES: Scr1 family TA system antitoxin-like transcriptional regulator [Nocardiopsis]MCY9785941.1 helix-turn-helix domain-containing protein [Nocardiopsis sp. EMB25]